MGLILAIFNRISNEGEHNAHQRRLSDAAADCGNHRKSEIISIHYQSDLPCDADNRTGQRQIALADFLEQQRDEENNADRGNLFCQIQRAGQQLVAEDPLAVIAQAGAGQGHVHRQHCPQQQAERPVFVFNQRFQAGADCHLAVLRFSGKLHAFLRIEEADQQQDQRDHCINRRCHDPCLLVVAQEIYQRQRDCGSEDASERRQRHADCVDRTALVLVAGHQRGQRRIRQVERRITYGLDKVVSNENVDRLDHIASGRYGEQQHAADCIRDA